MKMLARAALALSAVAALTAPISADAKVLRIWNRMLPGGLPAFENLPDATAARLVADGVVNPSDVSDGGAIFGVSTLTYSGTAGAGTIVTPLTDPYAGLGLGATSYSTFGTVPGQLALVPGAIITGGAAPAAGASYSIGVLAISGDGRRQVGETLVFTPTGIAPIVAGVLDFSDANQSAFIL